MSAHTPGPFRLDGIVIVGTEPVHTNGRQRNSLGFSSASYSEIICEIYGSLELPYPKANADFIVTACNSYEAMRKALSQCIERLEGLEEDGLTKVERLALDNARAALTLAETIKS